MHKSQHRRTQLDNHFPSKANSTTTTKDPNTCVQEELLNNELKKKTRVKMINDLKKEKQNINKS
jgi:chorismate mutase